MSGKLVSIKFKNPFKPAKRRGRGRSKTVMGRLLRGRSVWSLLLAAAVALGAFYWGQGKVVGVADGDTVTVLTETGPLKVRLYGIDCPEQGQNFGAQASDFVSDLVLFKEVKLQVMNTDRYGRSVAVLALPDGQVVNEALLEAGLAWVYPDYCKDPRCAYWLVKETKARVAGRGLWSEKSPLPPWQWRRQNPR